MLTSTKASNLSVNKYSLVYSKQMVKSSQCHMTYWYVIIVYSCLKHQYMQSGRHCSLYWKWHWDMNIYDWKRTKVKPSPWSFWLQSSCSDRNSNDLTALPGCRWLHYALVSCRPVYNDSCLNLHCHAADRQGRGRFRTLLCPGLDLFCPHLAVIRHLPRPAEEEWVREERWRQAWGHAPGFEFGDMGNRVCTKIWGKKC